MRILISLKFNWIFQYTLIYKDTISERSTRRCAKTTKRYVSIHCNSLNPIRERPQRRAKNLQKIQCMRVITPALEGTFGSSFGGNSAPDESKEKKTTNIHLSDTPREGMQSMVFNLSIDLNSRELAVLDKVISFFSSAEFHKFQFEILYV